MRRCGKMSCFSCFLLPEFARFACERGGKTVVVHWQKGLPSAIKAVTARRISPPMRCGFFVFGIFQAHAALASWQTDLDTE
jgi:hypothetical protein